MAQMYEPAVMVTVVPPDEGPNAGVMLTRLGCTCATASCATNRKQKRDEAVRRALVFVAVTRDSWRSPTLSRKESHMTSVILIVALAATYFVEWIPN
jgi:hypothetical protein